MTEILLKLFDFLLGGLFRKHKERVKLKSDFEAIKRKIIYCGIANELPVLLKELREFIVEHDLVQKPKFEEFFSRWLDDPIVSHGIAAINYTAEGIAKLSNDISQLKL